jgi:predicted HTH transcriptional regulator
MELMVDAELVKPVIESNAFFSITFERDPKFKVGGIVTEESKSTKDELSPRQANIVNILKNNRLSPKEILDRLEEDITDRTLRRDLQALKEKGYVDNEGQLGPKTKWFLLEPGH